MNLIGNFTALITPFNKNLSIDYQALEKLCTFQLNNFSDGIVALGSTAEAASLDVYEKHKVMETITSSINNAIPIIAGVNAFTLSDALYQTNARFLDGANGLLVSPPPYIKPTENGLKTFFTQIADHSYVPIILYNIPSRTGVKLNKTLVSQLALHPNIIGIKDASGDISYTQNIILDTYTQKFNVLAGNDNQLLPILSLGGRGVISVVGNINPKLMHDIAIYYQNNETNLAKNLYFENLGLIESLSCESNPIPIKYVMSKLNMIKPYFRPPLINPSAKHKRFLNEIIKSYFYKTEKTYQ